MLNLFFISFVANIVQASENSSLLVVLQRAPPIFAVYYLHCKDMGIKYPLQLIIPNRCRGMSYMW